MSTTVLPAKGPPSERPLGGAGSTPSAEQLLDHLAVPRLVEEGADGLGHLGAHVLDAGGVVLRLASRRAGTRAEVLGELAGGGLAHVADAERVEEAAQGGRSRHAAMRVEQVLRALLAASRSSSTQRGGEERSR